MDIPSESFRGTDQNLNPGSLELFVEPNDGTIIENGTTSVWPLGVTPIVLKMALETITCWG